MSNRQDDALPELPEPWDTGVAFLTPEGVFEMPVFTADQMREYAQSAIASLQARLETSTKALQLIEQWDAEGLALTDWHLHQVRAAIDAAREQS